MDVIWHQNNTEQFNVMKGLCWGSRTTKVAEVIQTTQTLHSYEAKKWNSSPPDVALPESQDVINPGFPESYSTFLPQPSKKCIQLSQHKYL